MDDLSAIMWHRGDGTGVPGVTNTGVVLCFPKCLSEKQHVKLFSMRDLLVGGFIPLSISDHLRT